MGLCPFSIERFIRAGSFQQVNFTVPALGMISIGRRQLWTLVRANHWYRADDSQFVELGGK